MAKWGCVWRWDIRDIWFVVKSDIPGYNSLFLTIFDFAIIFHLKNYLLGVIIFSTTVRYFLISTRICVYTYTHTYGWMLLAEHCIKEDEQCWSLDLLVLKIFWLNNEYTVEEPSLIFSSSLLLPPCGGVWYTVHQVWEAGWPDLAEPTADTAVWTFNPAASFARPHGRAAKQTQRWHHWYHLCLSYQVRKRQYVYLQSWLWYSD